MCVDSREQLPLDLSPMKMVTQALPTGDYSLLTMQNRVCIERKNLADLVQSFGRERERFERELQRMLAYDLRQVVIEAHQIEVEQQKYRGAMNPHALMQSIRSWGARGVPFLFLGDRERVTTHVRETLLFYTKHRLAETYSIFETIQESQNDLKALGG